MNTLWCSRTALHFLALAGMSIAPQYSAANDSIQWSRRLSTEYLNADSLQISSTSFAVQSSGGWFADLAASTEKNDISRAAASADAWSASSGMQISPKWNVAFGIDKWQGNGSVSQQTIVATLGYSAERWLLDLSFRQRELRIEGRAKNGSIRKHFETFDGSELRYSYMFNDSLGFALSYTNYQSNPGAVFRALQQRPELAMRLGDHSFGLVSGQSANAFDLTVSLQLQDWYLSAQANTADNYFNDANSTGLTLAAERSVTQHVTIGGEAGVQSSDDSDTDTYFLLAAHLYW